MNEGKSFQPAYTRKKDLFTLLILLGICLVTYWPLTFHVFSLKNDAITYFLPVRYQVSQSYFNGYLPLWSPYFNLGYPIHGDMQSGAWNPIVQLFSLFGPYTLYTLQIETLLYIFLGGVGMYYLLRHFSIHPLVNLLCATAYMLCGFNSDSGQYLLWISGSAFLPFVFLFYYRLLNAPTLYASCIFAFFFWLLFATAYPGEFIITAYMLAAMLLAKTVRVQKDIRTRFLIKLAGLHAAALLLFICLALPAILSFVSFLPLTERGTGASYTDAMSNPLHPLLTVAYIAPLSIFDFTKFKITDGLERNSWFGLFTFIFFLSAWLLKTPNKGIKLLKYAFIITFLLSLGEWGLLRIVAYYTLPLMNTFRHPAIFKLYSVFFGTLLAAFYLREQVQQTGATPKHRTVFRVLIFIIAGLVVAGLINSGNIYQAIHLAIKNPASESRVAILLKTFKNSLSFYNLLLLSIAIQLPFLISFYRFAIKRFDLKKIAFTGIVNCMVFAGIFTFFTIVKKDRAQQIQSIINAHTPENYPAPSLTTSLQQNSEDGLKYVKEIGTLNMYNKKIGRTDYFISPAGLLVQNDFWNNAGLRNRIMQYPVVYQPDTACMANDTAAMLTPTTKKIVFVTDSVYINQINNNRQTRVDVTISRFAPNSFHFSYSAAANTFLVVSQNRYPFWQATIDGVKTPIIPVNSSFMGVAIPAGKHQLHLDFKANHLFIAFFVNLLSIFLFIVYIAFRKKLITRSI